MPSSGVSIEKRPETDSANNIEKKLDEILLAPDSPARDKAIWRAMQGFDHIGPATLCKKDEMNWPTRFLRFNPLRVIRGTFFGD